MNDKEIHNMDEAMEDIIRHLVPKLKSFYDSCIKEGFTNEQSLELTKTFMTYGK